MKKKLLLIILGLMTTVTFSETSKVDISIGAKLVAPLSMTKSSDSLSGDAISGMTGGQELTSINISFKGAVNSLVTFSADQKVNLVNGEKVISVDTVITGGDNIVSDGQQVHSELTLSGSGIGDLEMGGKIYLDGNEGVGVYSGTANIQVSYN